MFSGMKLLGYFSVLFLVVGAVFISKGTAFLTPDSAALTWRGNDMTSTTINRKLKEASNIQSGYDGDEGKAYVDDYGPIDPVPSSKASVRPGPIQHGTPLMPYLPNPSPPPSPSSAYVGVP